MKDLIGNLLVTTLWLSIILVSTSFAIAIGYFLYLWGSIGIAVNFAAWSAFILWLELEAIGAILFLASVGAMLFV